MSAPTGLQALGLRAERGGRALFAPLHFQLPPGELLQLVGDNGSGKTTLLNVLAGLRSAYRGRLLWRGRPLRAQHSAYLAQLAYVGHATALLPALPVAENLRWLAALRGLDAKSGMAEALEWFGVAELRDVPCEALSAGQLRRVALTRLLFEPDAGLWLLDEPFALLDGGAAARLEALLRRHLARGGSVAMSAHAPRALSLSGDAVALRPQRAAAAPAP